MEKHRVALHGADAVTVGDGLPKYEHFRAAAAAAQSPRDARRAEAQVGRDTSCFSVCWWYSWGDREEGRSGAWQFPADRAGMAIPGRQGTANCLGGRLRARTPVEGR